MRAKSSAHGIPVCLLSALAFLLAALWSGACAPARSETVQRVWRLHQKHFIAGDQDVYFKDDAVKFVNSSLRFVLISKAPDWTVVVYRSNPGRKGGKIFKQPLSQWLATGAKCLYFPDIRPSPIPLRKQLSYVKNKLPIIKYKAFEGKKQTCEYELCGLTSTHANVASVMQFFYRLPYATGVPVRFSYFASQNLNPNDPFYSFQIAPSERVTTTKIEQVGSVSFDIPSGYKQVSDDREVIVGDRMKTGLEEIMRDNLDRKPGRF